MRLHHFSSFGDPAASPDIAACREFLTAWPNPRVAYLPAASLNAHDPQSDGEARAERDARLAELQVFYESPIQRKCLA